MNLKSLISDYKRTKSDIRKRLKEFDKLRKKGEKEIFSELAFCIFTPGSKAVNCDKAVKQLRNSGLLFNGTKSKVSSAIKGMVRFHNNKANYLVAARKSFTKNEIIRKSAFQAREWLVKNIKGIGYKEASHFLRNIGLGENIAILDRHILNNLKKYKIINKIPIPVDRKNYLNIEEKMRKFSKSIKIPLSELDLLFWSKETGFIFK